MEERYILRESKVVYRKYKKVKSLKFSSPETVYSWFSKLKDDACEKLITVNLNVANEAISFCIDSDGDTRSAAVYPGKVARNALLNNAVSVVIVHNHPSGNPEPSADDIAITEKLKNALATVEITLLDHIIVGDLTYYSMNEQGKM